MKNSILASYLSEVEAWQPENESSIEEFRLKWLSRKGLLQELFGRIKEISPEDRKQYGQDVNRLKVIVEEKFNLASQDSNVRKGSINQNIDLTLDGMPFPVGGRHPLTIMRDRLVDIFTRLGFVISEGPDIVDDWHNFTALNMPANHPARDMQDTFFVSLDPDIVLRTHTSSVQVQVMQSQKPPIRTISPGRVYRKDNDATHSPVFHQVEGLYVDENVSFADLKQTLFAFAQEMFGEDISIRFRPSYFPFTEPSAEMDLGRKKINPDSGEEEISWMEILGCGMVDPAVLDN
ncbi:MAG: phenylalanine--tRNA ligase subunit alpha, partial [Bacteroidota bacterium]|nr:phenylalanine--tRNA ligase subunit alpha [Bacteroidota bacterium]